MDIGARVRARRRELNLSQEAVARRANVSTNLVNRVENGVTTDPHYSTLVRLANALGVSVAVLSGEADPEPVPTVSAEKAEAAAKDAREAADKALDRARRFRLEGREERFYELYARLREAARAGDRIQAQVYADAVSAVVNECLDVREELFAAYINWWADEEVRSKVDAPRREFANKHQEFVDVFIGRGSTPVTDEERDQARDQARGETA
jgi:transcriptional regulator with XRE-family HTH domain